MPEQDRTETDPSVCYRHPTRQSWVLCQRCGRTICPECQILAPVGVQCPECVLEAGGSVRWTPTGGARKSASSSMRRGSGPAWLQRFGRMLRPEGGAPALSWGLAGTAVLLWIVGFFTSIPEALLAADPGLTGGLQVWRFVTGIVVYPSGLGFGTFLTIALSLVFWLLNAPGAERSMGRPQFVTIVLAAGIVGNAGQMVFGLPGFGLYGALFGIFAAYLIEMWHTPARSQILIMFAINLVLVLVLGRTLLPEIVFGALGGAGAFYVLARLGQRVRMAERTPYLAVWGGVLAVVVLVTLRLAFA